MFQFLQYIGLRIVNNIAYAVDPFYDGGGIQEGLNQAQDFETGGGMNIRVVVINIVRTALSFMGLIAVVVIIIAGIMLVVAGSADDQRDRARKIIIYAVAGLVLIILAQALVGFVSTIITPSPDSSLY